MGADFKEKTKRTFEKCWDKAAVEANTPDLFSKAAETSDSRFEAEAIAGQKVDVGESVCVRVEEGRIVGRKGITPVIIIPAPTACLLQSINEGCNVARADVVAVDAISGVVEVTIH
jgi:hypothetical protein